MVFSGGGPALLWVKAVITKQSGGNSFHSPFEPLV
ncbi:unnamed protein product, partial [Brassica oleracea var. botrytis]